MFLVDLVRKNTMLYYRSSNTTSNNRMWRSCCRQLRKELRKLQRRRTPCLKYFMLLFSRQCWWLPTGQEERQQSQHRGSSTVFYSEHGQVDTDLYLPRICFLNIINSDCPSQISLQNFRVIGFYNAVKKDINWFGDWLDNHSHHSFINIAIIWHFWMEEDCKMPADPVKHVKWRLVLLLSLSLVKDN